MIGYFNFSEFDGGFLITNDFGSHMFISRSDFKSLLLDNITSDNARYSEFTDKGFVYDGSREVFLDKFRHTMADSKDYLFSATSLHIFVVTNICNARCVYCQAQSDKEHSKGMMSEETARKAVDRALESRARFLTFEFQGGEPLINYDVIKFIVLYSESRAGKKTIEYNLVSNLTLLTDEMLGFFKEHNVRISVSLDGDAATHNSNRPYAAGGGTFEDAVRRLEDVRELGLCAGAIQTTTRASLSSFRQIIDTYAELGMSSIFLRPLTPLGFARERWNEIGYTTEEFLEFYGNCIEYIMKLNMEGTRFSEGHASIFLHKILNGRPVNYMELRSPCGAGIGQLAYYYDGQVFTCDEGRMLYEMGDSAFCLGTVDNTYNELVNSPVCRAAVTASLLESLPDCCGCVYQPFCGTCPVLNLAFERNIFPVSPHGYKCGLYGGIMKVLFEILRRDDPRETDILRSWIN